MVADLEDQDELYFDALIDPNGNEHQPCDPLCSGCDWEPINRYCEEKNSAGQICKGLNHYWLIEKDGKDAYIGYECEKCGKFENLTPQRNVH